MLRWGVFANSKIPLSLCERSEVRFTNKRRCTQSDGGLDAVCDQDTRSISCRADGGQDGTAACTATQGMRPRCAQHILQSVSCRAYLRPRCAQLILQSRCGGAVRTRAHTSAVANSAMYPTLEATEPASGRADRRARSSRALTESLLGAHARTVL